MSPLQSLLLSRDDQVIRVLRRVLNDMEIELEVFTASEKASPELARRKFDAIIVDCDDLHGAAEVLRSVRELQSNRSSTTFAIINGVTSVRQAFAMGANLALEKPITVDRARHSFRAAHGLMLQERRRYFRHEVEMAVSLRFQENNSSREVLATGFNLSEGGMALHLKSSLPVKHGMAEMKFVLPGTHNWMELHGSVAWADGQGNAGVRFENVPHVLRDHLDSWLRGRNDEGKKHAQGREKIQRHGA